MMPPNATLRPPYPQYTMSDHMGQGHLCLDMRIEALMNSFHSDKKTIYNHFDMG